MTANRLPLSLWFVIALLIVAALLITVPAVRAPSSGEVCNASTHEYRDKVEAEKNSAATAVVIGGLISLAAAIIAFVSAGGRARVAKVPFIATGTLGVLGVLCGVAVAYGTALVIC
jgi:hypothetical protein